MPSSRPDIPPSVRGPPRDGQRPTSRRAASTVDEPVGASAAELAGPVGKEEFVFRQDDDDGLWSDAGCRRADCCFFLDSTCGGRSRRLTISVLSPRPRRQRFLPVGAPSLAVSPADANRGALYPAG
jgi:hypothetical protein